MEVAGAAAVAMGAHTATSAITGNPCITDGMFPAPDNSNGWQLTFLTIVYGSVLFMASGFISDGSELLLLVDEFFIFRKQSSSKTFSCAILYKHGSKCFLKNDLGPIPLRYCWNSRPTHSWRCARRNDGLVLMPRRRCTEPG